MFDRNGDKSLDKNEFEVMMRSGQKLAGGGGPGGPGGKPSPEMMK